MAGFFNDLEMNWFENFPHFITPDTKKKKKTQYIQYF